MNKEVINLEQQTQNKFYFDTIELINNDIYNITINHYFLSTNINNNNVDLYYKNGNNQQWKINNLEISTLLSKKYLGMKDYKLILFDKKNPNENYIKSINYIEKYIEFNNQRFVLNNNYTEIPKDNIIQNNIKFDNYFLSVHENENIVDLYYIDDNSGRQQWIFNNDSIELRKGRNDTKRYLVINNNKMLLSSIKYGIWTLNKNNIWTFSHEYEKKERIALLLRGHIRNAFSNDNLYNFLGKIKSKYDVDIYIVCWDISESNKSWRKLDNNKRQINIQTINSYMRDIDIYKISILSDKNIKLNGYLRHYNWKSSLPLSCWKNMWFGINSGIEFISSNNDNRNYDYILNTRFDLFTVPYNNLNYENVDNYVDIIKHCIDNNTEFTFLRKENNIGVDNFYIGKYNCMKQLVNEFNSKLDNILNRFTFKYQETLVFDIANEISNGNINYLI